MPLTKSELLRLKVLVDSDEARRELDKFAQKTESTSNKAARAGDKTSQSFDRIRGAMLKVGAAAAAFTAAIVVVDRFAKAAQRIEGVTKSFDVLARRMGTTGDAILQKMRPAAQGLISDMTLMQQANNAVLLGLPVTAESMGRLTDAAVRLGRAMGIDANQALESIVVGIGRQSKLWLDNLGIVVDAEGAYKRYALQLGKTADQLTETEKKMAFYNATVKAAEEAAVGIGDQTRTFASDWQMLATAITNATNALIGWSNESGGGSLLGGAFTGGVNIRALLQGPPSLDAPNATPGAGFDMPGTQAGIPEDVQDAMARMRELSILMDEIAEKRAAIFYMDYGAQTAPGGVGEATGNPLAPLGIDPISTQEAFQEFNDGILDQTEDYGRRRLEWIESMQMHERAMYAETAAAVFGAMSSIFPREKAFRYAETVMNTAAGIMRAYADLPFPLATAAAVQIGAMGVAQLARISSSNLNGGGGGGGFQGSGATTATQVASTQPRQDVTVIIEGQGVFGSPDDLARLIGESIKRNDSRAGL